jgi:ankyrin repeat protein
MFASQNGHTEALALLLANGANVNAAEQVILKSFTFFNEND